MGRITLYGMLKYDPTLFDECILPAGYDKEALIDEILTNSGDLYPYHQQPIMLKKSMRLWFSRNYLNFDRIMDAITAEYNPVENFDRYEDWTRTPDLYDDATSSGSGVLRKEAGQTVTDAKTGTDTITHTYDLTEETDRTGTDTVAHTGTDETSHETTDDMLQNGNIVNEHKVSAFDSNTYSESYQDTQTFNNKEDTRTITGLDSRAINTTDTDTVALNDKKETDGTLTDLSQFNNTLTSTKSGVDTDTTTYGKNERVAHTGTESYTSHLHGNIGVTTNQQMITSEIELRKYDVYTDIAMRFEKEFLMQLY